MGVKGGATLVSLDRHTSNDFSQRSSKPFRWKPIGGEKKSCRKKHGKCENSQAQG